MEHETSTNPPPAAVSLEARRADLLQAAFRDVHAARLHGFALLVTLGDSTLATSAAARVMAEGSRRLSDLRHPERAAAWLRSRLVRLVVQPSSAAAGANDDSARKALAALGAAPFVYDALAALPARERIALVAGQIEGFDPLDVATILGRSIADTNRALAAARAAYLAAAMVAMSHADAEVETPAGEIALRILSDAARTLGNQAGQP